MRLIRRDDGAIQFAIAAQNVPPNEGREVYAVWGDSPRPRRRADSAFVQQARRRRVMAPSRLVASGTRG